MEKEKEYTMKQKLIPLEKQSKKKQREFYKLLRGDWNGVNPVTRATQESKAYNRAKFRSSRYREDERLLPFLITA